MVPPFKLEMYRENLKEMTHIRNRRIVYQKNEYQPKVKISNWHDYYETLPYDNCPYDPSKVNHFIQHYNIFGDQSQHCHYSTTTNDMLEQHKLKKNFINPAPDKKITNYFSFRNDSTCITDPNKYPEICAADYMTTMQKSYKPPYPYTMQRLSTPKIPYMRTRKMKEGDVGEDWITKVKRLQGSKQEFFVSYDFCTGKYTDGRLPKEESHRRTK